MTQCVSMKQLHLLFQHFRSSSVTRHCGGSSQSGIQVEYHVTTTTATTTAVSCVCWLCSQLPSEDETQQDDTSAEKTTTETSDPSKSQEERYVNFHALWPGLQNGACGHTKFDHFFYVSLAITFILLLYIWLFWFVHYLSCFVIQVTEWKYSIP